MRTQSEVARADSSGIPFLAFAPDFHWFWMQIWAFSLSCGHTHTLARDRGYFHVGRTQGPTRTTICERAHTQWISLWISMCTTSRRLGVGRWTTVAKLQSPCMLGRPPGPFEASMRQGHMPTGTRSSPVLFQRYYPNGEECAPDIQEPLAPPFMMDNGTKEFIGCLSLSRTLVAWTGSVCSLVPGPGPTDSSSF